MPWIRSPTDHRVKLDDLAPPDDNRDLNVSPQRHGLCPKLSGSATSFLSGIGEFLEIGSTSSPLTVIDSIFKIVDDGDITKILQFQCSGITTGTTRTLTVPNKSGTLALLDDIRFRHEWRGNGPFRIGTEVDGQIRVPTAMTVTSVRLYRRTAGSASSTIVDLNKNGTTMYTTQANRPTITAASGNNQASSGTLPDVTSVSAGDVLSMDIDQAESGTPLDLVLIIEGTQA